MPSPHWKAKYVQLSLTTESLNGLRHIAMDLEDEIEHDGTLKHNLIAHWAVHYLLSLGQDERFTLLLAGKDLQEAMEARAEEAALRDTEEPKPDDPPSTPASKTTARIWTRGKKSGKSDADRLNGDRPTGRKMTNPPRRK